MSHSRNVALALRPAAHILGLGQGAQELVLQLRRLGPRRLQRLLRGQARAGNLRARIDRRRIIGGLGMLVQMLLVARHPMQNPLLLRGRAPLPWVVGCYIAGQDKDGQSQFAVKMRR